LFRGRFVEAQASARLRVSFEGSVHDGERTVI
jgi:hypothetical protein